ncbi:hypothetical protein [Agromyces bauzanensis]|uniref:LysE family translocator n=1 Tax=Agromyces bauzanensis TaxID=1308924 RepID=A0A917PJ17_9MICO|nr:hypothetical protein [Agromyces bauzanensis]GGJ79905.1 hypothetical protein GCM10011372_17950 [Agromyces bauzanensis]
MPESRHDPAAFLAFCGLALMTTLPGATLTAVGGMYLVLLALVAAKANAWLNRPRVSRNLERTSGGVLAALGVGTIASAAQL